MGLNFNKNNLINNNKDIKIVGSPFLNNNGAGGVKSLEEIRKEMNEAVLRSNIKEENVKVEVIDKQIDHRDRINALNNMLKK